MVQRHAAIAAIYGFAAIGVWFYLRRPGGDRRALKPLTVVLFLLLAQGILGYVQWELELPTELVWLHVALATLNWLAMLWTIAAAGRLEPRSGAMATAGRRRADSATATAGASAGAT